MLIERLERNPRLSADEIASVIGAIGEKKKRVAEILAITPEHLSRALSGSKTMGLASEKLLRLYAVAMLMPSDDVMDAIIKAKVMKAVICFNVTPVLVRDALS